MVQGTKAQIAAIVTCYFVISIALVFSNKILMSQPGASIPAPLFVTWFQCVLTAIIIHVLGVMGKGATKEQFLSEFPAPAFDLGIARKVLPLSLVFVGMVTFNNLCLLYVEVSFYNVARSLTIVSNVILTRIFLGEKTSWPVIACLAVVIAGFFIGSDGEINFSLIGTIFGVLSSVFVSLNSILTKTALDHVGGDKWRLAYYNNVNASIIFLPLILAFGEDQIILQHVDLLTSGYFWIMMNIAGVLGFAIGIATVMQINYTSPLTHNISGTAKACVQTILALLIWRNPTTVKAMLGVFLVIFGSMAYTWVRMAENDREKAAKAAQGAYAPVKTIEPIETNDAVESDLELGQVHSDRK